MNSRLSNTYKILGALLILLSLTFLAEAGGTGEAEKRVAVIGKTAITGKDISYKVRIEKAYGNEGATAEIALISLVNDAIEHEIATIYGVTITREEIDSFKRYVDEQTKAPEILQQVKLLFGNDWSSYERIYLVPKIMNWKLHDFYSRSPEIHKKERSLIEKAYGLAVAGEGFQEAAEECGLKFSSFAVQHKGTTLPPELSKYTAQNDTSVKDPLIPILESLFPGEIYRNIVEDDYRYSIIRLIERGGGIYSAETITINKQAFDEWFREEAAKIEIEIIDPDLKKNIKTKYPDIWWVKKPFQKHED